MKQKYVGAGEGQISKQTRTKYPIEFLKASNKKMAYRKREQHNRKINIIEKNNFKLLL